MALNIHMIVCEDIHITVCGVYSYRHCLHMIKTVCNCMHESLHSVQNLIMLSVDIHGEKVRIVYRDYSL